MVNVKRKVERDPVTEMERVVVEAVSETDPSDNCDECSRTCNKPLPFCTHSCPLPCHLNDCDNCQVVVHLSCHCKLEKNRPIVCFDRLDSLKRETILSCGAKCTKVRHSGKNPSGNRISHHVSHDTATQILQSYLLKAMSFW